MQPRLKIQSCLNVLIDLTSPHRAGREVGNMLTKFEQQDRADITRRSTTHPLAQAGPISCGDLELCTIVARSTTATACVEIKRDA